MWSWIQYKLTGRSREGTFRSMLTPTNIIGHIIIGALMFALGKRSAPSR